MAAMKARRKWAATAFAAVLFSLQLAFLASDLVIRPAMGAPCRQNTQYWGPQTSTNFTELVEDQDDSLRITEMYYCVKYRNNVILEHFRGFRVTLEGDTGTFYQTFGTMDSLSTDSNPDDFCETKYITEEILYVKIYSDSNDMEGFEILGHLGTVWTMRANGADNSGWQKMLGRPIGFSMFMGRGGTDNQPLQVSIVFNECNCPASTFLGTIQPRDMVTTAVSGPADVASLVYQGNYMESIYEQNCGTYTITLSPDYPFLVKAQTGALGPSGQLYWDQLTLSTNDPIDIGQYAILMVVSQESGSGDGYTTPVVGQMPSVSYSFLITVNPCETTITSNTMPTGLTYTIGAASMTGGSYSFDQSPDCNYGITVELTNDQFFLIHQQFTNNFLIPTTENRDLEGTYTVSLRGYLNQPNDYTMTTTTAKEVNYDFDVIMVDPCDTTTLEAYTINDMLTEVHGTADVQVLSTPTDTVAQLYGDRSGETFCGVKTFTIQSVSPALPTYTEFLIFDDSSLPTLQLSSIDGAHQGVYTVTMLIDMKEYTGLKQMTVTFEVEILSCQVTFVTQTAVAVQNYIIYTPLIDFSWVDFDIAPCVYTLDYTYSLVDTATGTVYPMPPIPQLAISAQTNADHTFEAYSTDPTDVGVFEVWVTGTTPGSTMNVPYSDTLIIDLVVTNDCPGDIVTPTSVIPDFNYNIGIDGLVQYNPTWLTSISGCPVTYEIRRIDSSGVEQTLTAFETAVLSFDASDGSLDVQTSTTSYDGEVWTIKLFKRSTYGNTADMDGIYIFDITLKDPCWYSTLIPATMPASFKWDLWQAESMQAAAMINVEDGISCGGFTYELEYVSGPLTNTGIDYTTVYSMTEISGSGTDLVISGTPVDRLWLGTHTFRILCHNGSSGNIPNNSGDPTTGFYNNVYSDDFRVQIVDPCISSVVNHDNGVILQQTYDVSEDLNDIVISPIYSGPEDSAAYDYGNGYNLCDYLEYQIRDASSKSIYQSGGIIELVVDQQQFAMDSFGFIIQNYPGGYKFQDDLLLDISLLNYPYSTRDQISFSIIYRTCRPDNFSIFPVEDRDYYLTQNAHMVAYEVDQFPCDYTLGDYSIVQVDQNTGREINLPDFIWTDTPEIPRLFYETRNNDDVGSYQLRLYGGLIRRGEVIDTTYTDFILTVHPVIKIVSPNDSVSAPKWDIGLEDKEIDLEESLLYPVDIIDNYWGVGMTVTVDLGSAKDFVSWDESTQSFKVHQGDAAEEYIGTHTVCMNVAHFNSTYREEYNDCFDITVAGDDDGQLWKPPPVAKLGDAPSTSGLIISDIGLELGPYNPAQPIPYIADLSVSGVLRIGWDRTMTERDDFEEINPSRVGITDPDSFQLAQNQTVEVDLSTATKLDSDDGFRRGRQLYYQYEGPFLNETSLEEQWMLVVEALELKMDPGDFSDENALNMTWEMISFDEDWILIQCYFEYPQRVSEYIDYDTLEVFFWGVDWFRSSNGEPVRYGTKLVRPILRQIDPSLAKSLGLFGHILANLLVLIMLTAALLTGRLLPTWMFLNTLQLMSHLPLIKSQMPAPAAYFISQFLDLSRFNVIAPMLQKFAFEHGFFNEGALNMTYESYGYASMYLAGNMPMIIVCSMVILSAWCLALLKGYCVGRSNNFFKGVVRDRFLLFSHGAWMTNFTVRFWYEAFMTICISTFISLNKEAQENVIPELNDEYDSEAKHAKFDHSMAVILLLLILATLLFASLRVLSRPAFISKMGAMFNSLLKCCQGLKWKREKKPREVNLRMNDSQQLNLKGLFDTSQSIVQPPMPMPLPIEKPAAEVKKEEELYEIEEKVESVPDYISSVCDEEPPPDFFEQVEQTQNDKQDSLLELQQAVEDSRKQNEAHLEKHQRMDELFRKVPAENFSSPSTNKQMDRETPQFNMESGFPSNPMNILQTVDAIYEQPDKSKLQFFEGGAASQQRYELKPSALYADDQSNDEHLSKLNNAKAEVNITEERKNQHAYGPKHPLTRTLAYGLNVGKESSLADFHALFFLMRRFFFALCIVQSYYSVCLAVQVLIGSSICMFSLLAQWNLWEDTWIGLQHFVNELFLLLLGLIYIVLSAAYDLPYDSMETAGNYVIALVILFILFNIVIIIYDVVRFLRLHLFRMRAIVAHRRTRMTIQQVNRITERAQAHLFQVALDGGFQRRKSQILSQSKYMTVKGVEDGDKSKSAGTLGGKDGGQGGGSGMAGISDFTDVRQISGSEEVRQASGGHVYDGDQKPGINDGSSQSSSKTQAERAAAVKPNTLVSVKTKPMHGINTKLIKTTTTEFIRPVAVQKPVSRVAASDGFTMHLDALEKELKVKDELAFEDQLENNKPQVHRLDLLGLPSGHPTPQVVTQQVTALHSRRVSGEDMRPTVQPVDLQRFQSNVIAQDRPMDMRLEDRRDMIPSQFAHGRNFMHATAYTDMHQLNQAASKDPLMLSSLESFAVSQGAQKRQPDPHTKNLLSQALSATGGRSVNNDGVSVVRKDSSQSGAQPTTTANHQARRVLDPHAKNMMADLGLK